VHVERVSSTREQDILVSGEFGAGPRVRKGLPDFVMPSADLQQDAGRTFRNSSTAVRTHIQEIVGPSCHHRVNTFDEKLGGIVVLIFSVPPALCAHGVAGFRGAAEAACGLLKVVSIFPLRRAKVSFAKSAVVDYDVRLE